MQKAALTEIDGCKIWMILQPSYKIKG